VTTRTILTVGLLAILAGCLSLATLVSQLTGGAVDAALRENSTPDTAQRVTAVCVGLNIGSCRTTQESTSKRATAGAGLLSRDPWPVIALATAVIAPMVLWGMFLTCSKPRGWED